MPHMTFPIAADGLRMPALLGLDSLAMQQLQAQGRALPGPAQVRAQIDTGTVVTAVSPGMLAGLGAAPGAFARTQTASGVAFVRFYRLSFTIFDPVGVTLSRVSWLVTDLPQDLPDVDVLFGMDLVRELVLNVNGPHGEFSLDF